MNVNYVAESEILDNAEYLIVLGGDGTILQRAAECAKRKIPVLGINLGKIGFMTEIEIDDMEDAISKFCRMISPSKKNDDESGNKKRK